jgi:hypothetical protein
MEAAIGTILLDRNTAERLLAETDFPSLRTPQAMCRRASLRINAAASDSKEIGLDDRSSLCQILMTLNRLQLHHCQVFDSIRLGERKLSRRGGALK